MTYQDIAELALIIISSIGSAGAFILWLSDRLAKIWTERLLENERQKHRIELAKITTNFEKENQRVIEVVKVDLNIFKERYLKGFNDKFQVYRLMIDIIAEILGDFDSFTRTGKPFPQERFDALNKARIRIYGYIGMIAPQSVMEAQDQLIDYLLLVAGGEEYKWLTVREYGLVLINAVRKDIGVDTNPISYHGKL